MAQDGYPEAIVPAGDDVSPAAEEGADAAAGGGARTHQEAGADAQAEDVWLEAYQRLMVVAWMGVERKTEAD